MCSKTDFTTIGLMSGTSLDGVDAVAMRFSADGAMTVLGHHYVPYKRELRQTLLSLSSPGENEIERMGRASVTLAEVYAKTVLALLDDINLNAQDVDAVGVHGQTIRHRPEAGFTLQLNAPARVAALTGIDTIADFRSADVAHGGDGAPLVPAFHAGVFTSDVPRVILNLGGIANISCLPAKGEGTEALCGGDTGPANMLIDYWVQKHLGVHYDVDGALAKKGRVNPALLKGLLADPFFAQPLPKSTGRETFSAAWLNTRLASSPKLPIEDVARTLVELTAVSATEAIQRAMPQAQELLVCGGGALNPVLMDALQQHFPGKVLTTDVAGISPMLVEAAAFAWLAKAFCAGETGNLPSATGAKTRCRLGALYPAH